MKNKNILNIYKPIGLTPYQLIEELRLKNPKYADTKIGFAGRLDPLAHGVMLLMLNDETKNREKYLGLPKEYEFEVLFGIKTDTYDALGLLQNKIVNKIPNDLKPRIEKFVKSKLGKQIQKYPPYSSKTVLGKPLFQWARENKLSKITIPEREIQIYDFNLLKIKSVSTEIIKRKVFENIKSASGDFRQKEIIKFWTIFFKSNNIKSLTFARFKISCSSGTYIRSIANELGEIAGTNGIAFEILRTNVGEYNLKNSLKIHNS